MGPFKQSAHFTLGNFLFGAVSLTKNFDFDKYKYCECGIAFDMPGSFSLSGGSGFRKNVITSDGDMSSSANVNNPKKVILILGKGPTHGLDDTTLTAEKEYPINFHEQQQQKKKKNYFSLHF